MIKLNLSECTASSEKLVQQAELFLNRKVSLEPGNIKYLLKLGHLLRQKGELKEAQEYFLKTLYLEPENNEAKDMITILSKKSINDSCNNSLRPTPFVYIENYLSNEELQMIWNTVALKMKYFSNSNLANDKKTNNVDINIRKSITLSKDNLIGISDWFLSKVISELPRILTQEQIKEFSLCEIEMQLTRHGNNDFFQIHTDTGYREDVRSRVLTFVYYFHKLPKCFKGGEILLFDTDTEKNDFSARYTKLIPENNSIVFFPSNFYHQVTPVYIKEDNFDDGRFSIHGWVHKKKLYEK